MGIEFSGVKTRTENGGYITSSKVRRATVMGTISEEPTQMHRRKDKELKKFFKSGGSTYGE